MPWHSAHAAGTISAPQWRQCRAETGPTVSSGSWAQACFAPPSLSFDGHQCDDSGPQMLTPTAKQSQINLMTRGFWQSGRCVWIRGSQNHQRNPKRDV
jgi:hypothetical protein